MIEVNKKYNEFYGVVTPKEISYKISEMFDAALQGNLKALWIIVEDVVQTDPTFKKVDKSTEQHRSSNWSGVDLKPKQLNMPMLNCQ